MRREYCVSGLRKEVERMNKEMLHRMKTAGEYQKKAIRALLPEKMGGHLDVIEKEIKMMVVELAADALKECKKKDACEETQESEQSSNVKKVDIL